MLRQAFLHVVAEYPEKVLETHLLYKPLLIWETLSASTRLEVSRRTLPILIALAVQLTILIVMARLAVGERSELSGICAAFALIAVFSVAPQLFAWSSLATSSDLVCYLYVGVALLLAAALRSLPALRYARA